MKKVLKFLIVLILFASILYLGYVFINTNSVENVEIENVNNITATKNIDSNISGAEQDLIEDYIGKIYLGIGLVDSKDVLPEFLDINNASTDWILNCIHLELARNSESNIFSEDEIKKVQKELFSDKLTIELPVEDSYGNIVKNEEGNYVLSYRSYEPDYLNYYIVDSMKKINDSAIEVNLIEYRTNSIIGEEIEIKVYRLDSNEILFTQEITDMDEEGMSESDRNITNFVAENKEKFSKVKLVLEKENESYYVKSIER